MKGGFARCTIARMTTERNWAGTQVFVPRASLTPTPAGTFSERIRGVADEIRGVIGSGRHLRAMGSMWSFGTILTSPDTTLHLDALSDVIATRPRGQIAKLSDARSELEKALFSGTTNPDEAWALVGAGISTEVLIETMDKAGLSPVTLGSSTGQRLGGVMATASHGADFRLPPIADMALAVVLIRGDGTVLWVEGSQPGVPASARLTFARTLVSAVDQVVSSDAAIDAARASVGVLGVVAAVLLRARARYGLQDETARLPFSAIRPAIVEGGTAFGATPPWQALAHPPHPDAKYRFLEILLNPYPDANNERHALVIARWERPGDALDEPKPKVALDVVGTYVRIILGNQGAYRTTIDDLQDSVRPRTGKFLRAYRVMTSGGAPGYKVHSYDVGIPVAGNLHLAFLDELLARWKKLIDKDKKFTGFLSLRFTEKTRATLGMEHAGLTAHFEIFALQRPKNLAIGGSFPLEFDPSTTARDSAEFLAEIDPAVKKVASAEARYHWGQLGPLQLASSKAAAWQGAFDALYGKGKVPRVAFANDVALRSGLIPPPDRFSFTSVLPTAASTTALSASGIALSSAASCEDRLYALNADGRASSLQHPAPPSQPAGGPSSWERVARIEQGQNDDPAASPSWMPVGSLAVAPNADGHHEIFTRCAPHGFIFHRWQLTGAVQHLMWSEWTQLKSVAFASDPSAIRGRDLRVLAAAVGLDGKLHFTKQNKNQGLVGWDDWQALPLPTGVTRMAGRPALLRLAASEAVLARGQGVLWGTSIGTTGWASLGASAFGFGAAAASDGKKLAVARAESPTAIVIDVRKDLSTAPTTRTATLPSALRPDTELAVRVADNRVTVAATLANGDVVVIQSNGTLTHFLGVEATGGPTLHGVPGGKTALYARVAHDKFVYRVW